MVASVLFFRPGETCVATVVRSASRWCIQKELCIERSDEYALCIYTHLQYIINEPKKKVYPIILYCIIPIIHCKNNNNKVV